MVKRSSSSPDSWSLDQVARQSRLRRALPVLALLVCFIVLMNAWQSWHDFRAADAQAAHRLEEIASLIAGRVEDRTRDANVMTDMVAKLVESGTLSDAEVARLPPLFHGSLGDVLIAVVAPDGRLLAASRPGANNQIPGIDQLIAAVRDNPSIEHRLIVPRGQNNAVASARGQRNRDGGLDAIVIRVVPFEPRILEGVNLSPGTAILLRNSEDRVIARYPPNPMIPLGQVMSYGRAAQPGPTPTTRYIHFAQDATDRLVATRRIALGPPDSYWTLDVGYAVNDYRAHLWTSLYMNLAGSAVAILALASGMLLIRHERQLQEQIRQFVTLVSHIVENMPTPVAVVELRTEKISLANDALLSVFGAVAGAGQPFSRLFVDPGIWPGVRDAHGSEAIAMLARDGVRYMQAGYTDLELQGQQEEGGLLLVTLVDVSHHQQLVKQLRSEADYDALTGLANRRYFTEAAKEAVALARQQHYPLSVLALDLDHFKRVNDTYGHASGDVVLQSVARLFEGALRRDDLVARVGGEEFTAILMNTDPEQARKLGERVRMTVETTPIVLGGGATISQTVSIGIAAYHESEADLTPTLERADAALYKAKDAGRNRVQIFVPEAPASQET